MTESTDSLHYQIVLIFHEVDPVISQTMIFELLVKNMKIKLLNFLLIWHKKSTAIWSNTFFFLQLKNGRNPSRNFDGERHLQPGKVWRHFRKKSFRICPWKIRPCRYISLKPSDLHSYTISKSYFVFTSSLVLVVRLECSVAYENNFIYYKIAKFNSANRKIYGLRS